MVTQGRSPRTATGLRRLLLASSIGYVILLVVATHVPGPERFVGRGQSDKLLHFIAYALLGGLVTATLASTGRATRSNLRLVTVSLILFAAADETTQPLFRRTADPVDWAFDVLGILAGLFATVVLVHVIGRERPPRA